MNTEAPVLESVPKVPFYPEDNTGGYNGEELKTLVAPSEGTPDVMNTEEPVVAAAIKVPFYVEDDRAPTEPSALVAQNESAAIL